jgi:hypothetical protein
MISKSVKAALLEADKKQLDLGAMLDMSKQTMSNKMALDRWKGEDLLKVAELTGSRLAFVFPNGKIIEIEK